jgi:cold shock CspA family protein
MSTESDAQRLTGMVKWFNNKSGFGFITVCGEDEFSGKDIFAHYSSIRVTNSQYKYLVQGEYIDFALVKSENEKHEFHAMDITGVMNGPILCETRRVASAMQTDEKKGPRRRVNKSSADMEQSESAHSVGEDA